MNLVMRFPQAFSDYNHLWRKGKCHWAPKSTYLGSKYEQGHVLSSRFSETLRDEAKCY